MIISISICQWVLEVVHLVVYLSYVFLMYGQNFIMDNIFQVYLMAFGFVLQPSFYLMGDKAFRNDLADKGLITALKTALLDR